jgi:hypothetical protein
MAHFALTTGTGNARALRVYHYLITDPLGLVRQMLASQKKLSRE